MLRKKLTISFMALLASLILSVPAMALTGAKGPGTTDKVTNLTAIAPLGGFLTGAYLQVTLLDTNANPGQTQITFPANIDVNGPNFYNANQIIGIQYDNVQPAGSEMGLLFYSDNSNATASYRYTGGPATHGGLIGQDGKSVAPIIFSMYKEMRQHVTNYRTLLNGGNPYNKQPPLPTTWAGWTNKIGNYDFDGYFNNWLSDITDPGYTWHTVGSNGCSLVNNIAPAGLTTFDQAKMAPAKGNLTNAVSKINQTTWWQFNGPFGGWTTGNKYDNNWVHYNDPNALQLVGTKNECFVYMAASFKGKPIQNYKTSKLVVEVYSNP